MLKKILSHSISINKQMLWLVALLLILMTAAVANTGRPPSTVALNDYGVGAPFLKSWLPIWIFAAAGGAGSLFFKIDQIDKHFRWLMIAKPFLGLFGALSLCLVLAVGVEPQPPIMSAYAFLAALMSAPLLQALLAVASLPRNQAELFNTINPFRFKVVVDDKGDSKNDAPKS